MTRRKGKIMIHIYNEKIDQIPVLHVVRANWTTEKLPTLIYYHGFTSEKESSLALAYKLAERGIRVILPDSYLHGERSEDISLRELNMAFWDVVITNIEELQTIRHYVTETGLALQDRLIVGGTSMGAITTYGALRVYDWIYGGLAFMGSPSFVDFANLLVERLNENSSTPINEDDVAKVIEKITPYDLAQRPSALNSRPLFIWHGTADDVVPIAYNERFYRELLKDDRLRKNIHFLREKDRAHHVSTWSIREATTWLVELLEKSE